MSNSRLKVLLVSPLPPPAGGIAYWSVRILHEAAIRDDIELSHVDTAVRWRSTGDERLWKRLTGGTRQAVTDTFRVLRSIIKVRPKVLHLCTSGYLGVPKDIMILSVARILGVKSIVHYRRGDLPEIAGNSGVLWKLMRSSLLLSHTALLLDLNSEKTVNALLPGIRTKVIPNPVDEDIFHETVPCIRWKKFEGAKAQIVFAGWVVHTKGIRELVEACLSIGAVPFELNLVGHVLDDFRKELEFIASQRDGGTWLKFHGVLGRSEALSAIGSSDLFVLPSYTEGFPNVVSEAMSLGRPIIATRVGAIPDMLGDSKSEACGMLISPKNVEELRAAIIHMLSKPDEAKIYGERAKQKAMNLYSMKNVMEQYVRLWQSMQGRQAN